MPYILNKTNGSVVAVVQDAAIEQSTDLIFVGRNYSGYGEIQNENFIKLLENFSNSTAPTKPIQGELWFDSSNKKLNVYDNKYWKTVANLEIASTVNIPSDTKSPTTGDLWFNTTTKQVNVYDGSEYIIVGPPVGADARAQWKGDYEYSTDSIGSKIYNIKAVLGSADEVIAIVSAEEYTMTSYDGIESPLYPVYAAGQKIAKGITLNGADPVSGSSRKEVTGLADDLYFWGTAKEAEYALYATTATFSTAISSAQTGTDASFYVPFLETVTGGDLYSTSTFTFNPSTGVINATATSAYYADLAERYEADAEYDVGTVLVIGGNKEVTTTNIYADTKVIGIVSKQPAYLMNSDAGSDKTHPAIALKGRVPCKVKGKIAKGDLLVTSTFKGYAETAHNAHPNAVIGKALQSFDEGFGVIEVLVV